MRRSSTAGTRGSHWGTPWSDARACPDLLPAGWPQARAWCDDRAIDRRSLALAALAAPGCGARRAWPRPGAGASRLARRAGGRRGARAAARGRPRARGCGVHSARRPASPRSRSRCSPRPPGWACTRCPRRRTARAVHARARRRGTAPAAAAHAALLYPGGRLAGALDRAAVALGYVVHVGLLGLLPALVLDPRRAGCFACPDNLLLVHADPGAADWLARWAPRAAAATEAGARGARRRCGSLRRPPAARSLAATGVRRRRVAVLALSAIANLRAAGGLARTATDRDLWLATVAALGLLARSASRGGPCAPPACAPPSAGSRSPPRPGRTTSAPRSPRACGDPGLTHRRCRIPRPASRSTLDGAPAPPPLAGPRPHRRRAPRPTRRLDRPRADSARHPGAARAAGRG